MSTIEQPEPSVGIMWLVCAKLIFDATPLSEAETYGDHRGHPGSHIAVWAQLQKLGTAPPESEYEEYPRGRVMYHPASEEFTILADQCILSRIDLVEEIKSTLHLPRNTKTGTDPHYRCFTCLYGREVDDDDDDE
jgi:hypothetical protein